MPNLSLRGARFRYDAVTGDGRPVSGTVRATTRARAREQLSVHRLELTSLDDAPGLLQTEVTTERLRHRELEGFVAQLSVFTRSGVPLPTALLVIAEETEHRLLRRTATDLARRLTAGQTLGDAIDAHADVLPTHVRGVLRSADASGDLTRALTGLHTHLERQATTRRRLVTALVYPGVVAVMAVVTMGVLAGFALPRFSTLFTEMGAEPPWVTRIVSSGTRLVAAWWPIMTAGMVTSAASGMWWLRSPRTRHQRDHVWWHVPGVAPLVRVALAERVCRVLALTTSAGLALPHALEVATDVSHHTLVRRRLQTTRDRIIEGVDLITAIETAGLFPSSVRQILTVGVRTGTLDQQWGVAADLLAADVERRLQRLTALLEPALIVVVGVVVAGVAVSLVTSLYGVVDQLGT
jgi:type II secretory pathway component PulF